MKVLRLYPRGSFKRPGGFQSGIRGEGYVVSALKKLLYGHFGPMAFVRKRCSCCRQSRRRYRYNSSNIWTISRCPIIPTRIYLRNGSIICTQKKFIESISRWLLYEGDQWNTKYASRSNQTKSNQNYKLFTCICLEDKTKDRRFKNEKT